MVGKFLSKKRRPDMKMFESKKYKNIVDTSVGQTII
jgi:hypothetical protein